MHDDNPPLDAAFMAGMKPSRRGRPKSDTPKVEIKIRLDAKRLTEPLGSPCRSVWQVIMVDCPVLLSRQACGRQAAL
jgi:hypothetical protein